MKQKLEEFTTDGRNIHSNYDGGFIHSVMWTRKP